MCFYSNNKFFENFIFVKISYKKFKMLVNQKLDQENDKKNIRAVHLSIKWHPIRDILSVASSTISSDGFLSFYTKKVNFLLIKIFLMYFYRVESHFTLLLLSQKNCLNV